MDTRTHSLPLQFTNKDHEALMNVWWTALMLKKMSSKFFQPELASEAQFNILVLLKDARKPLTQREISDKMFVNKSNMTGLLTRLEAQGLIERLDVENDKRSYNIRLTSAGKKIINRLDKRYLAKVHEVMDALTDREQKELIRLLTNVRAGLSESSSDE
jgi:DNA-binding MarR family transcriptional regulator